MNLGLIANWTEESFIRAKALGIDFLEFCVNGADDADAFLRQVDMLRRLSVEYGVGIGSIGRWKVETICPDGQPDAEELRIAYGLIEAAARLGSPVYVCGCNEVESLSYYENCTAAIRQLSLLLEPRPQARSHHCHLQLPQGNLHSQCHGLASHPWTSQRPGHQVRSLSQHLCGGGLFAGDQRMGQPVRACPSERIPDAQWQTGG